MLVISCNEKPTPNCIVMSILNGSKLISFTEANFAVHILDFLKAMFLLSPMVNYTCCN